MLFSRAFHIKLFLILYLFSLNSFSARTSDSCAIKLDPKKTAGLMLGQNYPNTKMELGGCANDARNIRNFWIELGVPGESLELLVDEDEEGNAKELIDKEQWSEKIENLATRAHKGELDTILLSCSGHGSYKRDRSGKELDGFNEVLVFGKGENMLDDEINELLRKFPCGCTVAINMDTCHSETMGDLPYTYGKIVVPKRFTRPKPFILPEKNLVSRQKRKPTSKNIDTDKQPIAANIYMISGCLDYQTSMDAYLVDPEDETNRPQKQQQGAFTNAFLLILKDCKEQGRPIDILTLRELMNTKIRSEHFSQCIAVSSSHIIPAGLPFLAF